MPAKVIKGEPGSTWTNDGTTVMWQLQCSLINTCGSCLQYHMQIATYWAVPLHRQCRCRTIPCAPGTESLPFANYREILKNLPEDQHIAAVGKANWTIIDSGLVKWSDVVTPHRVREFHQVIAREKLTVAQLVKAGVAKHIAEEAWAMVHTPEHEKVQDDINKAADALRKAGLTDDQIITGFAERIVPRITGIPRTPTITGESVRRDQIIKAGGTPAQKIIAGYVVLERIRRGTAEPMPSMPDFQGSRQALEAWITQTFPDTAHLLTRDDWMILLAVVAAQEELKKIFKKLGVDSDAALKAIK